MDFSLFQKNKIIVIGDVMLDRFIFGKVSRISPEAPVPVVDVVKENYMPGGAGNVAYNIISLGSYPILIGAIGNDFYGNSLLEYCYSKNILTNGLIVSEKNTIVKTRIIAENQQVIRVDRDGSKVFENDLINLVKQKIDENIDDAKGVIISDYGKGLINNETLNYVIEESKKRGLFTLVDPKIENFKKYKGVTCITPNLLEAKQGMERMNVSSLEEIEILGKDILNFLGSSSVLITRSENGMSLFEKDKIEHIPTVAKEVFDVTGAGDTVISTLAVCLSNGLSLKESAYISNYAAGIVVGKLGTATTTLQEIEKYLK